jgi:hypothetical protein
MAPRPKQHINPFVEDYGTEEENNLLSNMEPCDMDIRVESIIHGAVDAYRAENKTNYTDIVSKIKMFQILKGCNTLTTVSVQDFMGGSTRQSQQYMAVLGTATKLIINHVDFPLRRNCGLIDLTYSQIEAGYFSI